MSGNKDNSTIVITNIYEALHSTDREAAEKPACLLVVGGDLNGTIFNLPTGVVRVGRSAENEIPLDFRGISRHHFEIETKEEKSGLSISFIRDLGSSNGTFLNNARIIQTAQLRKNDVIKVGTIAFKYLPKGDPERLTYDKLHLEANTDGLTQCFNKTYFNNSIEVEVKKSKITGNPLCLIVFDLDHFKKLNDTHGHDAGDYVLKEMAGVLRSNGVREGDIFARYGGEEFVVLLPKTNLKQGFEIAERLRKIVQDHNFVYEGKTLEVTASVGVADYRQGVNSGQDLFKRADQAVYDSKSGGRNRVSFFRE